MQALTNFSSNTDAKTEALFAAGGEILRLFQQGKRVGTFTLKNILSQACGGSDADGYWQWKDAYEAIEIALVQHLIRKLRGDRTLTLEDLVALEKLYPAHNKRTEESIKLQQFSTPVTLSYLAALAARITDKDMVLEPSAGNGMLAVFAAMNCFDLALNEIDTQRAAILDRIFSEAEISSHNGEQINDRLDPKIKPSVVLINPPFSSYLNRTAKSSKAAFEHLTSALRRLQPYGRLVCISQESLRSNNPVWTRRFIELQENATIVASLGIAGKVYYRQGTTIETRMTVIDKVPAADKFEFADIKSCTELTQLEREINLLPKRSTSPPAPLKVVPQVRKIQQVSLFDLDTVKTTAQVIPLRSTVVIPKQKVRVERKAKIIWENVEPLVYKTRTDKAQAVEVEGNYAPYQIQRISLPQAKTHPSPTVESLAMAAIDSPVCTYQPLLPKKLISDGILSDIQLESIIRAGQAHQKILNRWLEQGENGRVIHYPYAKPEARQIRQGWICGDGTGIGKGRQIAGILLDNWLQGRQKAVWISVSAGLIEASRRDWQDLGGKGEQIVSLNKYKPNQVIDLKSGILFLTYSTLRQPATKKNQSRLEQITQWLGNDFDGVICFDECHAMGGAASTEGERGLTKASKQGLAGLKLQQLLPDARVIYVSATGASRIMNLAYAERLGLWGTTESAFKDRNQFFDDIGSSGLAALEIVSRELKARGLYLARSLSFVGVKYEILVHELTPEQIEIFDKYADAFKVIHQNIDAALTASRGKGARHFTYGVFESTKQRFFNQLLISLSCVSLIAAIERDLAAGYAPVLQIVSTNEEMLERALSDIPCKEWNDLKIDISPKSYILEYLNKSFPIHLMETIEVDGNLITTFATDGDGQRIINQEALEIREAMILSLVDLPPIHSVLDQIIFYFGTDRVAEVSGRKRRLVKVIDEDGQPKIAVKDRESGSNLAEQEAFASARKQILFFSKAGGTGFDFHASKNIENQRLRRHYLIESGWNAAQAVQGFGRTNRSNQLQPPVYILLTTNVLGQKRFTSSIASRLSSLGAITKGQAQTGSNGLFKAEYDLNNRYAQAAVDQLIADIYHRHLPGYSFEKLEADTGLTLSSEGKLMSAPKINRFLNRLLALRVEEQNYLFSELEHRIKDNIAQAKEAGHYETGMQSVKADSITLNSQVELWQDPESKAKTIANKIIQKNRLNYLSPAQAIAKVNGHPNCKLLYNQKSQNVCYSESTYGINNAKTGEYINYFNLCFADTKRRISEPDLERSNWVEIDEGEFARLWQQNINNLPVYKQETYYLLTGLLLPIWDRLKGYLRIQRVVTDDKEVILGRLISLDMIPRIFAEFDRQAKFSPSEILQEVEAGHGCTIIASLRLANVIVMHERRFEVKGWNENQYSQLLNLGCYHEVIKWQKRLFVPKNNAETIIEQIIITFDKS